VTINDSANISETEEISSIMVDEDNAGSRCVTITVFERDGQYYADYHLHRKDAPGEAPRPEGYIFHRTENISTHDLYFMRLRVKEEADYRGLGHVRGLGF